MTKTYANDSFETTRRREGRRRGVPRKDSKTKADYVVHTDGGCAVNPGGAGGIGVVIVDAATGTRTEISRGFVATTNNRMEITAMIVALNAIPKGSRVALWSDSQYALKCAVGVWSRSANQDLWRAFDEAADGKRVEFRWTRGHAGDPENERCDELATAGIESERKEIDRGYAGPVAKTTTKPTARKANDDANSDSRAAGDSFTERRRAADAGATWRELAERYHLKETCAKALATFASSEDRSFKAYARLKTGGIDAWSRKQPEDVAADVPDFAERFEEIRDRLDDAKDFASAARWIARGLTVDEAARKAEVDAEIRRNCR